MKAGNRIEVKVGSVVIMVEGNDDMMQILFNIAGSAMRVEIPHESQRDFARCAMAIGKTMLEDRMLLGTRLT